MGDRSSTHWVFAYGSNLNLQDLGHWLTTHGYDPAGIQTLEPACLDDYQLIWDYRSPVRQGGAANVAPSPGQQVYGGLLRVDSSCLDGLDHKEGHPERYNRGTELVACRPLSDPKSEIYAWVYEVQPAFKQSEFTAPRRAYRDIVVAGAQSLGLPGSWIEHLRSTPTLDSNNPNGSTIAF